MKNKNGHLHPWFTALTFACILALTGCGGGGSSNNDIPPPNDDDTPARSTTVINGSV